MRCSSDLRKRVIDFVRGGGSKAEAARRFNVGEASVYRWLRPGGLKHKRPGPKTSRKLDWEALRRHVDRHDDFSQKERAKHFGVSRHCIWNALQKMELTRKKNDGLQGAQPYAKKKVSASS
jgi:transposase